MCTGIRFVDDKGNMYFGRNLDWIVAYGQKVTITPKGFARKFAFVNAPADPNNIIGPAVIEDGVPLYFDCGNDAGLAIAGLNFPGEGFAKYSDGPIDGKVNVAAYEFPLWVASNFKTVDAAEAALANVAIVGKPIGQYPPAMLHWLIGDKTRSIVVEYTADGMHIHHNDVDVLTNHPSFPWQLEHLRSYINISPEYKPSSKWGKADLTPYGSGGQMVGLPGSYYSPDRFVRSAYLNTHYPTKSGEKDNVTRLFRTLLGTSMIEGGARVEDGTFETTEYTGGFSTVTNTYYMSLYDDPAIKSYAMDAVPETSTELYVFD